MDNDLFLLFIAFWAVFVLLPCWLAGSTRINRPSDDFTEPDYSGIESTYPSA